LRRFDHNRDTRRYKACVACCSQFVDIASSAIIAERPHHSVA
jgi:hypothetical protein